MNTITLGQVGAVGGAGVEPSNVVAVDQQPLQSGALIQGLGGGAFGADHIASPSALFDEALGKLRGFFKRADLMSKPGRRAHDGAASEAFRADLHGGPALTSLELKSSADSAQFNVTSDAGNFQEFAQRLLDSMSFQLEAELLAHSTSGIGTSINTLVKGQ